MVSKTDTNISLWAWLPGDALCVEDAKYEKPGLANRRSRAAADWGRIRALSRRSMVAGEIESKRRTPSPESRA